MLEQSLLLKHNAVIFLLGKTEIKVSAEECIGHANHIMSRLQPAGQHTIDTKECMQRHTVLRKFVSHLPVPFFLLRAALRPQRKRKRRQETY
jgi:hypothetical protein